MPASRPSDPFERIFCQELIGDITVMERLLHFWFALGLEGICRNEFCQ